MAARLQDREGVRKGASMRKSGTTCEKEGTCEKW